MTETTTSLAAGARGDPAADATRGTRRLLAAGAVAGPLFVAAAVLQMPFRPGFDIARHAVSALSLGDAGWIQVANFVATGVLTLALAVGLRRVLHPGPGGTWGPSLIALHGVGLIIAGVFTTDPAFGFPPGAPAGMPESFSGNATIHTVAFMSAFSVLVAAAVVFARAFSALGRPGWAIYSLATAVVALVLVAWPSQEAASVRYFVAALSTFTWLSALAVSWSRALAPGGRHLPRRSITD